MRLILPAAGLGTRAGMKHNESKELLINPDTGKPLIEFSLEQFPYCDPLVITRSEKTDLIQYCEDKNIECQIIKPEGEWANTVLMSETHWHRNNILILPDTIFEGKDIMFNIKCGLELGNNAVFATHFVANPSQWGIIKDYSIIEKPQGLKEPEYAWGLIGFRKDYGNPLFTALKYKNSPHRLNNVGFTNLTSFKDLTRDGKLK